MFLPIMSIKFFNISFRILYFSISTYKINCLLWFWQQIYTIFSIKIFWYYDNCRYILETRNDCLGSCDIQKYNNIWRHIVSQSVMFWRWHYDRFTLKCVVIPLLVTNNISSSTFLYIMHDIFILFFYIYLHI